MVIKTDLSKLEDAEIGVLQNHYAEIMSRVELLVQVAEILRKDTGEPVSITFVYASCKTAILELGAERERRMTPRTAKRQEAS